MHAPGARACSRRDCPSVAVPRRAGRAGSVDVADTCTDPDSCVAASLPTIAARSEETHVRRRRRSPEPCPCCSSPPRPAGDDGSRPRPAQSPRSPGRRTRSPRSAKGEGKPPKKLVVKVLKEGNGADGQEGRLRSTPNYLGQIWKRQGLRQQLDAAGQAGRLPGRHRASAAAELSSRAGTRRWWARRSAAASRSVVPPAKAYGEQGSAAVRHQAPRLVFVVDLEGMPNKIDKKAKPGRAGGPERRAAQGERRHRRQGAEDHHPQGRGGPEGASRSRS